MAEKRKIDLAIIVPDYIPRWKFWIRDRPGPSLVVAEDQKFFIQVPLFTSVIVSENFSGVKPKIRLNVSPDMDNSYYLFLVSYLRDSCGPGAEYTLTLIDSSRYDTELPLVLTDVVAEKTIEYSEEDGSCHIMLEFSVHSGLGLLTKTGKISLLNGEPLVLKEKEQAEVEEGSPT